MRFVASAAVTAFAFFATPAQAVFFSYGGYATSSTITGVDVGDLVVFRLSTNGPVSPGGSSTYLANIFAQISAGEQSYNILFNGYPSGYGSESRYVGTQYSYVQGAGAAASLLVTAYGAIPGRAAYTEGTLRIANVGSLQFRGDAALPAGAVPEPATWAMMISGFGLVGGAMRRRSCATAM